MIEKRLYELDNHKKTLLLSLTIMFASILLLACGSEKPYDGDNIVSETISDDEMKEYYWNEESIRKIEANTKTVINSGDDTYKKIEKEIKDWSEISEGTAIEGLDKVLVSTNPITVFNATDSTVFNTKYFMFDTEMKAIGEIIVLDGEVKITLSSSDSQGSPLLRKMSGNPEAKYICVAGSEKTWLLNDKGDVELVSGHGDSELIIEKETAKAISDLLLAVNYSELTDNMVSLELKK